MTWCNPNCDVTFSYAFSWEVVLSLQYQNFDFALKSSVTIRDAFVKKFPILLESYQ